MPIRYGPVPTAILSNRARPYMRWTARLLQARLRNLGLSTWWGIAGEPLPLEEPLSAALCRFMEHPNLVRDPLIAHPVSRPRKQVFTAHNYPLNTPLSPGVVRQPSTVKRRIIVNRGILRQEHNGRVSVRVVTVDEPRLPEEERLIIIGTLCEGERAGHSILGIVGAIFSTGKLALMRPTAYREQRIIWERILVSSRKSLHVRSRERILFLRLHVDK